MSGAGKQSGKGARFSGSGLSASARRQGFAGPSQGLAEKASRSSSFTLTVCEPGH